MTMDEALRRAYLAAMDISVWIPRSELDPLTLPVAPSAPVVQPAEHRAPPPPDAPRNLLTQPRARRGQSMLGERERPTSTPKPAPVLSGLANPDPLSFTFGFFRQGNTLLIDAKPLAPRGEELCRAICFAVDGTKATISSQDFSWPPRGAAFVAAEARDALLARIDKFGGGALARLLVSGASPALVLLGWSAEQWKTRPISAQRVEGLACDILLLPDLDAMLHDAAEKRVAWEHIRTVRSVHA